MQQEQLLSSIIKNSEKSIDNQNLPYQDRNLIEQVKQLKLDVIHKKIDPSQIKMVSLEIVESWIRSYNYGIDVFQSNNCPNVEKHAFKEILRKNDFLIKATISSLSQFESLLNANYVVHLSDPQGVQLLVNIGKNDTVSLEVFNLIPGAIWNEKTMGTTSFSLCHLLHRPVQVCGPENYLASTDLMTGSSAPIFDLDNKLAGILTIGTMYFNCVTSQTLSLVVSIAELIQKEFQLAMYKELIRTTHESSLEAVIVINKKGIINSANMAAKELFKDQHQELIGIPINLIIGDQPIIKSVLEKGKLLFESEFTIKGINKKLYSCTLYPIRDFSGGIFECILKFKYFDRSNIVKPHMQNIDTGFSFDKIIGNSPEVIKSINLARNFSTLDSNILLEGESGTGKDVYAQSIHIESKRSGPFVAVNCAAIPKSLIESEMFGYEKGAFTGAERTGHPGKIEQANGGTLFLDEIGDMPLELQPVLLRVLEEKKVVRVGGSRSIPVNFKLVAATNKDLLDLVNNNKFRQDLYYRLAVFKINIPPLRDRGPDIINLTKHFIKIAAANQGIPEPSLNNAAKFMLLQYNWPGNVRQLQHSIIYAVNMSNDNIIKPEHFPDEIKKSVGICDSKANYTELKYVNNQKVLEREQIEKSTITKALLKSGYNISRTAQTLGISRSTLYRKIKQYNL
ncbi:MAG TPA: sigma-54-dependent Fis family transcriptional regulator [Syntrophomonas sp.]|jgi:transcriptional regulator with PAS, ATPase and Fis domain|nr:sigma-54-dependent Fis family transcriptional regulator [Syntrophomonas sp.]HCF71787.1 sigma-54-dependent Fis family transcriptional regulator [Syntrophomonas sp.]